MVEGLDGSGKGVAVEALKEHLEMKGLKIFDLRKHCKEHVSFPKYEEIQEYDVIVSAEPTYGFVGRAIRDEIIKESTRKYSGTSTAHAFSLDREILYKKLLILKIISQMKTI